MILMNDFQRMWQATRENVMAAVEEVGSSGWYILGKRVREFESALAAAWGVRYAVGTASGLDAIEIGLRALGCGPGDKVLTTPLSAFATTLAIVKTGATPVFADTDRLGLIDLDACEALLKKRPDIRYFVPVHLYGHPIDSGRLGKLRDQFGLAMVEDCAQSIGAASGTAGQVSATSFYPTKNLGAIGDGGALLTSDPELRDKACALRDYGQTAKYRHDVLGLNSRLDELQAGILHKAFLPQLPAWIARRRAIARLYMAGIRNPLVCPLGAPASSESCWHLFPVLVHADRKADFITHLRDQGVASGEHYPIPIPKQKALDGIPFEAPFPCPNTERICRSEVSLPIHPYLTDQEAQQVIFACDLWQG